MDTRTIMEDHPRTTRNETIPRWSRGARLMLGAITFLLIGVFAIAAVASVVSPPASAGIAEASALGSLHVFLFAATFAQFLLILFYVSFAAQNPRAESRFLWMIGMVVLPFATLPIYWWVHVWKAPFVADPHHDYNVPGGQLTPQAD